MEAITAVVEITQEILEGVVVVLMVLLLEELVHLVKDLLEGERQAVTMELEVVEVPLLLERMLLTITVAVTVEQDFNVILMVIMIIMVVAVVEEDIITLLLRAVMEVSAVEAEEVCIMVLLEVEELVRGIIIVVVRVR